MLQHLASFAVLAAALAPQLAAQRTAAWNDSLIPEFGVGPIHHGVRALSDGDTIQVVTRLSDAFDVRRLDTNGDLVFAVEVPRETGDGGRANVIDFDISPAGDIVLLTARRPFSFSSDTVLRAIRLDAAGTLLWSEPVPASQSMFLDGDAIQFASTGEIVVGGGRAFGAPSGEWGAWIYWLDGSGVEQRSLRVLAVDHIVDLARDGSARVLRNDPSGTQTSLVRVNDDATIAWTTPIASALSDFLWGAWVGPAGETVLATAVSGLNPAVITKVDASGAVLWDYATGTDPNPRTDNVQFLPGGDIVTSGPTNFGYVRRFGPNGSLRFEVGSLNFPEGATSAAVDAFDRTWFTRINMSTATALVHQLNVVDAGGVSVAAFTPPVLDVYSVQLRNMAADARGNVYAAMRWWETFAAGSMASTVKLVLDSVGSAQTGCDLGVPNSTGLGGRLSAAGSDVATIDGICLLVDQLPASTLLLPLVSPDPSFVPMAGGSQGTLCLGGTIGRFRGPGQVRQATAAGATSFQVPLDRIPRATGFVQAMAGETWHFQGWYRDANPGATSNFTNAWTVSLQ